MSILSFDAVYLGPGPPSKVNPLPTIGNALLSHIQVLDRLLTLGSQSVLADRRSTRCTTNANRNTMPDHTLLPLGRSIPCRGRAMTVGVYCTWRRCALSISPAARLIKLHDTVGRRKMGNEEKESYCESCINI